MLRIEPAANSLGQAVEAKEDEEMDSSSLKEDKKSEISQAIVAGVNNAAFILKDRENMRLICSREHPRVS